MQSTTTTITYRLSGLLLALGMAQAAMAADAPASEAVAGAQSQPVTGMGQALGSDTLAAMRGGEDTTSSEVVIGGDVTGNTADHVVSGDNTIHDGAFANAAGINTIIQNSGNNVLIQNGAAVNVVFSDPMP